MRLTIAFICCFFLAGILQSATLRWAENKEPDLAGYIVYFGSESGEYDGSVDVGNETQWPFNFDYGTYYFVVTAYDFSGNESTFSREAIYIVTGIELEEKQNIAFQVSPNPFYGEVKIQAFGVVRVFNILGQQIEQQEVFGSWFILMGRYPPGIYFFLYEDQIMKRTKF